MLPHEEDYEARVAAATAPKAAVPKDRIEEAAKAIYELLPADGGFNAKTHPWQPNGNSMAQMEARRYARAALEATTTPSEGAINEKPYCVECSDEITHHDSGVCGNCYSTKYATPSEGVAAPVERQLTDEEEAIIAAMDEVVPAYARMFRHFLGTSTIAERIEDTAAPAQPSADQVRDAALAECEGICADIYRKHRDQYKGRGGYAPDNPRRADPHCDGCADGAAECEEAISKLRTTASGEKGADRG